MVKEQLYGNSYPLLCSGASIKGNQQQWSFMSGTKEHTLIYTHRNANTQHIATLSNKDSDTQQRQHTHFIT